MGLFNKLTDALKGAAPIIGGVVGFGLAGPMGASIGAGIGGLASGQDVGTSLGYAALGYGAGYLAGPQGLKLVQPSTASGIGRLLPEAYAPGAGAQIAQSGAPVVADKMGQVAQQGFFDQGIGKFMADHPYLTGAAALGAGALLLGGEEEEAAMEQRPFPKGEVYFGDTYTDPFTGEEYSYETEEGRSAIRESKAKLRDPMFDYERDLPAFRGYSHGGENIIEGGGEVTGPGTGTSDSVPARLSDGEFVLTAKAVRNAGGGDRNIGAARMYDMMAELEAMA
jgi:hypothetical protein